MKATKNLRLTLLFTCSLWGAISWSQMHLLLEETLPLTQKPLAYKYDALLPIIDAETMEIHYSKHHQAYTNNANQALPNETKTILEIFKNINSYPSLVRNNLGGHFNHQFFWTLLNPISKFKKIPKRLEKEIKKEFGSWDNFISQFETAGTKQFGSGWVWLIRDTKKNLKIVTTANQDNPLMSTAEVQGLPILGVDVWEHAYYLNYQNKRATYLKEIWKVINWTQVNQYDEEALKSKSF